MALLSQFPAQNPIVFPLFLQALHPPRKQEVKPRTIPTHETSRKSFRAYRCQGLLVPAQSVDIQQMDVPPLSKGSTPSFPLSWKYPDSPFLLTVPLFHSPRRCRR